MIKNIYRIIILNDRSSFNKSITLSNYFAITIFILMLVVVFFSGFGVYKIFYPHPKQKQMDYMHSKYIDTSNLLTNLINKKLIDSTLLINYKLDTLFTYENSLLPNNMPVEGIVTKGLGNLHSNHKGIDIAATFNSKVYPAQKGIVVFSGNFENFGNTVIIAHPNNYYTMYSHLNKIYVKQRDLIYIDNTIGTIGQSGNSDGPHLHFEIWKNNTIIDPRDLIKNYRINDVSIK